jgi:diguanylate cyclase (GGDEF)-like protein/PAS domain S-box-containing protein
MKKEISFIVAIALLSILYIYSRDSQWVGSTELHTMMELVATILALMIGVLGLIRFYAKSDETIFLFIGAGFLGTGFLDGYHTVVTSSYFAELYPSPPENLIPWSWIASRLYLSIFLFWAYFESKDIKAEYVYRITLLTTTSSFLFFAFVPLPQAYYPELFFHRPEELLPALFFGLALHGFYKKGEWKENSFHYWLVLSLIVNFLSQTIFMSFSEHLFDYNFDMAHLLKKVSYITVLIGVFVSMLKTFQREEEMSKISKKQKEKLAISENLKRHILVTIPDMVWLKDIDGVYISCNPEFEKFFGAKEEDIVGKTDYDFVDRELADFFREHDKNAMNNDRPTINEEWVTYADHSKTVLLETTKTPLKDAYGNTIGVLGIGHDITKNKELINELNEERNRYLTIIRNSSDAIFLVDENGFVVEYSQKFEESLGYSGDEVLNLHVSDFEAIHTKEMVKQNIKNMMEGTQHMSFETVYRKKDGSQINVFVRVVKIVISGKPYGYSSFNDITEFIEIQQKLAWHQNYDSLTNLPNKKMFKEQLYKLAKQNRKFAVILLDIDYLKNINESFGHRAGDIVLKTFASWLTETISDIENLSRYQGNSFGIILNEIENDLEPVNTIENLKNLSDNQKIRIAQHSVNITFSSGIIIFPNDATDVDTLLQNLDAALYSAKEAGRNTYAYYKHELTDRAIEQVLMTNRLRDAIKKEQFRLYYQPQYCAKDDKLVGFEALIRWYSDKGIIPPFKFIPILESSNLIIDVGEWIIKTAFEKAVQWNRNGLEFGVLSINLSMVQLKSSNHLVETVEKLLAETSCKAEWIGIEVTESMAIDIETVQILNRFKELGFTISLDDFGTGYSSLSYLKKLPIHKLKIDKSFVDEIPKNEDDSILAKTIISMAKSLKLQVIAEGVENIEQKEFLLQNGCSEIQGYLYSKPLPETDADKLLKRNSTSLLC